MSMYDDIIASTKKYSNKKSNNSIYDSIISTAKKVKSGEIELKKPEISKPNITKKTKSRSDASKILENLGSGTLTGIAGISKVITTVGKYLAPIMTPAIGSKENVAKKQQKYISSMGEADKIYSNIINQKQQQIENTTSSIKSPILKKASTISASLGNIIPSYAPYLIPVVGPVVGPIISGASSAGQYMTEAENKGASENQKLIYGTALGIAEGLTDSITFGSAFKALKLAKNKKITKSLFSAGITAAENAVQEAVMEPTQELTNEIVLGKSDWTGMGKRMLNSSIDGVLVGIILGGASSGLGKAIAITDKVRTGGTVTKTEIKQAVQEAQKNNIKPIQINTGVQAPTTQNKTVSPQGSEIIQPSAESSIKGTNKSIPPELSMLYNDAKNYKTASDFKNSYQASDLMDLSNPTKHRFGRLLEDGVNEDNGLYMNAKITADMYGSRGNKTYGDYREANVPDVTSPDELVTIYRGTTNNQNNIEVGDFVTFSKDYALMHNNGENLLSMKVPAKDVVWQQNDLNEWIYSPEKLRGKKYNGGLENIYKKATQQPTNQNKTVSPQVNEITQPSVKSSIKGTEQANMTIKDKSLNIAQETTRDTLDLVKDLPTKLTNPKKVKAVTSDFYRNIRDSFEKPIADRITGNFDKAKLTNVNMQNELANDLKTNIVDKLGIEKGSVESELVQRYGEKEITLKELKQLAPYKWQNIVEADKYFRSKYNELIDSINAVRKTIYPNVEAHVIELENKNQKISEKIKTKKQELTNTKSDTKKYSNLQAQIDNLILKFNSNDNMLKSDELLKQRRVLKRDDYYRHFQEESEKFSDIFSSAKSDIDPKLVGISSFTKPNAKWSSIATRRTGNKTKYDAVGGFLNYIPQASFMINIDPQISNLRTITKELRTQMSNQQDSTAANELILHLDKLTNKLAGKQTDSDRIVIDYAKRKKMKIAKKIIGRIKSNMILGNVGSAVSQVLNMPQIIGKVKNPSDLANGLIDTIKGADYSQSQFITERYKSDIASQFDTKLIDQPKKFALWMVGALDEVTTKAGWNAFYRQSVRKGIDNPIQYADNLTREMVGGRGLGEKTIAQESFAVQTLAPFTVEVGNTIRVYKDMLKDKDFVGLFITIIASYLLNKGLEEIRGTGGSLDILGAVEDALGEEDTNALQKVGRVAGEVLSNTPSGQFIAGLIPETDTYFGETKVLPKRSDLFGKNDPTRFGTGSMITGTIQHPITSLLTPWGGKQIEKTIAGIKMFDKPASGSYTKKSIEPTVSDTQKEIDKINNSDFSEEQKAVLTEYLLAEEQKQKDLGLVKEQSTTKEQLRFPVEKTTKNVIQAVLFGQYASKEAVEYFKKNKLPYSEKATKLFNDNATNGISSKDTISFMEELKKIDDKASVTQDDIDNIKKINPVVAKTMKPTKSKTRQKLDYIKNTGYTETQQSILTDYILSDSQKEKKAIISNITGLDNNKTTQFYIDNYGAKEYEEYKNILKLEIDNSKKNKLLAMSSTAKKPVTVEEIEQVEEVSYKTFAKLDYDARKKYIKLANAGIDQEELVKYYKGKGKIKGIKGRNGRTISGTKKAAAIKFVQTLSLTRAQKIFLLEQAGYKMR